MFNEDIDIRFKSGKCAADTLKRRYTNKSAELKESYKKEQIQQNKGEQMKYSAAKNIANRSIIKGSEWL